MLVNVKPHVEMGRIRESLVKLVAEMFLDHHLKPRSASPQLPSEPPSVKV
jgi:hypothetical protein